RLQNAFRHAGETEGLLFHATVPLMVQKRPVGLINIATEQWEFLSPADLQFLSAAGSQVAVALERARLHDLAETQRTRQEKELEMARVVQKSLLPTQLPSILGFTLAADWRPAREVAGDFYDFFSLPDGRWGMVLADVSGKGAPAALYMAMARSLIRSEAGRYGNPSAVLTEVNRRLLAESCNEMFVTVFYAIVDPVLRSLTYANAGHDPPFLRHASGGVERLAYGGLIMGPFEALALSDETLNLESGDTLVAYTDGLTDSVNHQDEAWGHTRLADAINSAPAAAQDILTHILKDLAAFAGPVPQPDDITLLILTTE
ncbi:MAG: SpoIIE family protein phosphatase, partial [Candidatus Acidiferrum sp.]